MAPSGCLDVGTQPRGSPDRAVVPFLNGAGPSTGWSERVSGGRRRFGAASGAGRGQRAAPAARSARTNGVEAVAWSTQDLFAGVVDSVVVVFGFNSGTEGGQRGLPAIPSRWC